MTSGEQAKAKQFLPFLTRQNRVEALVEFVASGSRVRVYIPKETCLLTLLLNGKSINQLEIHFIWAPICYHIQP